MRYFNFLIKLYFKCHKKYDYDYYNNLITNQKNEKIVPKLCIKDYRLDNNIYYFNINSNSNTIIIYMHGGAYLDTFSKYHFKYLKRLIKKTNANVIAPNYGLIPFYSYKDAFDKYIPIIKNIIDNKGDKKVIFMGDSAGGGLILSMYQYLKNNNYNLPEKLVLLSPWVDINLSHLTVTNKDVKDPWINVSRLKVCARLWASDLSLDDYKVSPINGNINLCNTLMIFGTNELLYPTLLKMKESLDKDNTNKTIIGKGMLHVYPILPLIGNNKILKEISEFINK